MTEQIKKTLTTEMDDIGQRLDVFLSETEEDLTRSQAQKLLQDGLVSVNGVVVPKNYKIRKDDLLGKSRKAELGWLERASTRQKSSSVMRPPR